MASFFKGPLSLVSSKIREETEIGGSTVQSKDFSSNWDDEIIKKNVREDGGKIRVIEDAQRSCIQVVCVK